MKTWELIKALQEGKYISHPDYEGGRKVRLKDIDKFCWLCYQQAQMLRLKLDKLIILKKLDNIIISYKE